ncbi:MAG: hypothetical protein A2431_01825 [Candidatus Zambryskibacteria bacterium RIFOXYC1_FULL_39_10]|uniref:Uncharacterized protein n=1 Tax=Candidatus Zambryskibacteria bacterium RIFOXYC1_FULL_39_10 TaxID=1802779 RepID=A0A1G2V456_9BACT|nr:MAG: hypothetical protein A2605_02905 [Candidatus Zambryskibacteria bacterium RIFOXYD1_FULL_39_35]OHB16416.1 MAG: hypothetical protein A2431_01825 [Candidatus Zambryskibacteria bacterium RIFOXYC1_FULL_39_10]
MEDLVVWYEMPRVEIQVEPVLQGKSAMEVVVAKPKPAPPLQAVEKMVAPFSIRTIDHDVSVEQIDYHVHARDFDWLHGGDATFAKVVISRSRAWEVESSVMLTYNGKVFDCVDKMIGAFAKAGMMVNRRLIDACLFPIQNQILEVERRLKSFA